jgi:hypothetical protein
VFHGHIVSYWVRGGQLYNVVAIIEDSQWRDDGWNIPAELSAVRAAFDDWDPRLQALFGAAGDIRKWALLDHPVPSVWSRGRIALLGDACHAMLPYLAQGGAILTANAAVHEWHARCVARKCAAPALIAQCRAHALEVGEPYGIWGGLSESEGDLLLKREMGRARSIGRTA